MENQTYEDHPGRSHSHSHGHSHSRGHSHGPAGPRVAWFLTLPALALLLFPPPALGSYSAEREAAQRAAQGVGTFPALPSGNPVDLALVEFGSRAVYDSGRSLKGRTVRLTGFVTRDTWVTVTGTWHPEGEPGSTEAWPPVVDATSLRRVRQPDNPHEKR
ncbi:hypothetical protein ACLQ2D_19915 [Streptomyces sp. DT199]|uniref:hypothetical protein n=1 Tax=Streptomyces sp. DT199 TaxID=3393421 RepID=UPI003CF2DCA6